MLTGALGGAAGTWAALRGRRGASADDAVHRRMLEALGEAFFCVDLEGRCTFANPACLRLLGYPAASALLGQRMHELIHHTRPDGGPYPRSECPVEQVAAREGVYREEEWLWRADGTSFRVELRAYPLWDEGERRGTVVTFLDGTRRHEVEEARARELRETREVVHDRDDFLAIASHELRTPLTPLRLGIQHALRMLTAGHPSTQEIIARLTVAERQVMRLSKLVEGMLDMSRLTRGALQLERVPCDLGALVHEVMERSQEVLTHVGCTPELRVEGPLQVLGDRLRLEQVLENLLSNATKYGAGCPIHVHCRAEEGQALLSVEDEGIGISPEDQQRIFGRFERASSVRHYGGFGLGLYLLREIVDAHGGSVSVRSQPGQGACFTVKLPLLGAPGT